VCVKVCECVWKRERKSKEK